MRVLYNVLQSSTEHDLQIWASRVGMHKIVVRQKKFLLLKCSRKRWFSAIVRSFLTIISHFQTTSTLVNTLTIDYLICIIRMQSCALIHKR